MSQQTPPRGSPVGGVADDASGDDSLDPQSGPPEAGPPEAVAEGDWGLSPERSAEPIGGWRRVLLLVLLGVIGAEVAAFGAVMSHRGVLGLALALGAAATLGILSLRAVPSRLGAIVPGLAWLTVAMLLSGRRPEGDVLLVEDWRSQLFLLVGSTIWAVLIGVGPRSRPG